MTTRRLSPLELFNRFQAYLDPNCSRADWVTRLMAAKAGDDSDAMREAVRVWSRGGVTYDEQAFNATWRSITPEGGVGFGTLVKLARESGWPGIGECGLMPPSRPLAALSRPQARAAKPIEKIYGWTPPGSPIAVYYYNAPSGAPRYRKVRYRTPTGKITPFQRYDPARDAWIGGPGCMEGVARVLYRNEQLSGYQRVFIVEGEKCSDILWDYGILAVCNDSGAGHWWPEFSQALRVKDVVILPDNDEPGRNHAATVARSLVGIARSIKIVELPGLGPKEDVYDWLTKNGEGL